METDRFELRDPLNINSLTYLGASKIEWPINLGFVILC